MCGIVAIWGERNENLARALMRTMTHRGPDGEGLLDRADGPATLGHRRLSIIDPAGGRQPIETRDGAAAIVANGMIYNDRALRGEFADADWVTGSDSESILQGFRRLDTDIAKRLDGMFAFVVVDGDRLVAARDPVGIKPLYMGRKGRSLLFASEATSLSGLADSIQEFPAGHVYDSRTGFRRYYTVPEGEPAAWAFDDAVAALRETLEAAVAKRLRSDVPLGAFLSGGLDSSIIAALARRHVDELHTFAVGLEGSADLAAARRVADHLGTTHHELVIRPAEIARALPGIVQHLESYDRDLVRSAAPTWFVAAHAAERVKVVLTGEGADELFAGYRYYKDYGDMGALHAELRRSITAMHNVNLQRVDRMTMAHGLEARVPFLDTAMIELGLSLSPRWKLRHEPRDTGTTGPTEKWILRKAFEDMLPEDIVWRTKAQFDEGSGFADLLASEAERWAAGAGDAGAEANCRSAEEAGYRRLLAQRAGDPDALLALTAFWDERSAA